MKCHLLVDLGFVYSADAVNNGVMHSARNPSRLAPACKTGVVEDTRTLEYILCLPQEATTHHCLFISTAHMQRAEVHVEVAVCYTCTVN